MTIEVLLSILTLSAVAVFLAVEVILRRRRLGKVEEEFIREKWSVVEEMCGDNPKYAVIEADKLIEYVFHRVGIRGSFGEVLKKHGSSIFSRLDDVWVAHKLRNRVVHDVTFSISSKQASSALKKYKLALNDLGIKL